MEYLFRGTTKGFKGGTQTIKAGVTPTSSNPAVATLYSIFNKTNHGGDGIVEIARTSDMINSILGSGYLAHDREVVVKMLPEIFSQKTMNVTTGVARSVLKDMGINLPAAVKDASTFDQLLKGLPDFSGEQVLDFFQRVTGNQN
ncbi:hypothetical protein [Aquimarina sp. AU119]|uniref:hypothetical protein n=1 Tax=Aquimarina sp. AU119 TaxID=2108528 RepID=UPI000D69CBC9|nr:hypothetical protein [Aquimarina sp. AU119]